MVQIKLLKGTKATPNADFSDTLPINLEPVPNETGISTGYLRSAMGATTVGMGPGPDRGAILYNGICHRVMGTKLITVTPAGFVTILGDVGDGGPAGFTYGFDRLAIQSGTSLFYWNGSVLTQVTDPDLGPCLDAAWLQGQYFTTDGTDIIATDITDPTSITPTRYGAAEADPDMVTGLFPLRNEMYVCGSNTIEVQTYTGGSNFPLTSSPGATIPIGVVGPRAKCSYSQTFAFVGGGRNHAIAVWLAGEGTATKLSTRAVDDLLAAVMDQTTIELEARVSRDEERLYVHLPNQTLVYLFRASQMAQTPVWYVVSSGIGMNEGYRPRHAILVNGAWIVGDTQTGAIGVLTEGPATVAEPVAFFSTSSNAETWSQEKSISLGRPGNRDKKMQWRVHRRFTGYAGLKFRGNTALPHFGEQVGWQIQTDLIYNSANSFILHDVELVGLSGRGVVGFAACEANIEKLST